ncbi:MAG: polysaccharide biosynthesis/export family protein [Rhodospirillales bacterium]|nr:polysaccharide biosynthesis/export family protein [Acetobacter sp.]
MKKGMFAAVVAVVCTAGAAWAQDAQLRPGDSFELRISGVPAEDQSTISGSYTIDGQGYFNLSFIGKVKGGGRTASEVQSSVERTYIEQGIFTHPTIALNIAPTARFVNVGGPGVKGGVRIPYTSDMTVLSAITAAGDFNEFADQRKVRLIRNGKVTIIDCKQLRRDPSKDINVLPGDNIQVPETMF